MRTVKGHIELSSELTSLKNGRRLLHVRCSGFYAVGCAGSPQAKQIYDESATLVKKTQSKVVLLDFSDLDYQWGDDMWWPLQLPQHPLIERSPVTLAVILGEKNREAMISLIEDDGPGAPWQQIGFVFETEPEAIQYLESKEAQPPVPMPLKRHGSS